MGGEIQGTGRLCRDIWEKELAKFNDYPADRGDEREVGKRKWYSSPSEVPDICLEERFQTGKHLGR